MSENESMCIRILSDVERIIRNDPALKHFSIIPEHIAGGNCKNKNPVVYVTPNLALEEWCIKHIYAFAYRELFKCRPLLRKKRMTSADMQQLNKLLIGALLIQPNVSTFWNMKRELIEQGVLDPFEELHFDSMVLSEKSKSQEAFNYRVFCINKLIKMGRISPNGSITATSIFTEEIQVAEMAANNAKHNYHAWNHRIWAMKNYLNHSADSASNLIMCERNSSLEFITKHVSEHAAFNYRQYVLTLVKKFSFPENSFEKHIKTMQQKLPKKRSPEEILGESAHSTNLPTNIRQKYINYFTILLIELLCILEDYFQYYMIHESVWYHRRFVIFELLKTFCEYHGQNVSSDITRINDTGEPFCKNFKTDSAVNSHLHEVLTYTESIIEGNKASKAEKPIVEKHIIRHKDWLREIMHLNLEL